MYAIIKGFDITMLGYEEEVLTEVIQLLNRVGINAMGQQQFLDL